MGYLYEVLFAGVETVVLQWIIRGFAVMICGLVCFLLYRFYGKVRMMQENQFGQRFYAAAEDSFRTGNRNHTGGAA